MEPSTRARSIGPGKSRDEEASGNSWTSNMSRERSQMFLAIQQHQLAATAGGEAGESNVNRRPQFHMAPGIKRNSASEKTGPSRQM